MNRSINESKVLCTYDRASNESLSSTNYSYYAIKCLMTPNLWPMVCTPVTGGITNLVWLDRHASTRLKVTDTRCSAKFTFDFEDRGTKATIDRGADETNAVLLTKRRKWRSNWPHILAFNIERVENSQRTIVRGRFLLITRLLVHQVPHSNSHE